MEKHNMSLLSFKGGIHPYDGKELSKDKAIIDAQAGKELVYPLSQHIGAPAKAIVAKGDRVLCGQCIAEAGGFVSAPVYSSVSGTVKGIEKRRSVTGDMIDSIIIENDGEYEQADPITDKAYEDMSREEVIDVIKKAGIVGMGGAGFPTHVKLSPKDPDKIDTVIVNCAECEPYLTSDYRRCLRSLISLLAACR
jgi:electron transport complex protein RnfC